MMHGQPQIRSSFDNDERHVIAFRPISAAACWSYDNTDRSAIVVHLCKIQ